jgi:hypothetical protein
MGLSVNFGDKLTAGNHISVTILTSKLEGNPKPAAVVKVVDGDELETTVKLIDDNKYKLRFFLPGSATGQVAVSLKAGSEQFEDTVAIA